jgi:hypothetical protein
LKECYVRSDKAIPLFVTGMGDILVWEDNYLMALNFRRSDVEVVAKNFDLFIKNLQEKRFLDKELDWLPYPEAAEQYGLPAYDECFGYVPLLSLGGAEKVEKLKKVKLIEHIQVITHFMGMID